MRQFTLIFLALLSVASVATESSQYAGEESRSIKSLSAGEIESLRTGGGMGFAKLAELNHYPGPRHVLDLASALRLTPQQLDATEALFGDMQARAITLGEKLLDAELDLDLEFRNGTIGPESLRLALDHIGSIRAQLRYVHLEAHLRQKELLTKEQIARYDEMRGYGRGTHHHSEHPKHHE